MTLNDQQLTTLTKNIVKYCIIPQLPDTFSCPSYENIFKAFECLQDSWMSYEKWLDQDVNTCEQVDKIYSDIKDNIIESLKEIYNI